MLVGTADGTPAAVIYIDDIYRRKRPTEYGNSDRQNLLAWPQSGGAIAQGISPAPGTEVRVRRVGRGVLLEPMERSLADIQAVFAEIDRLGGNDFLPEGRPPQPPMPRPRKIFDE